jgi:hypothetical protein
VKNAATICPEISAPIREANLIRRKAASNGNPNADMRRIINGVERQKMFKNQPKKKCAASVEVTSPRATLMRLISVVSM